MERQILRLSDVMRLTGLKRSSLYSAIQRNEFPKQILLRDRCVGWVSTEVDEWISKRIAESRREK